MVCSGVEYTELIEHPHLFKIPLAKQTWNTKHSKFFLLTSEIFLVLNSLPGCNKYGCNLKAPNSSLYFCIHTEPKMMLILLI